MDNEKSQARYEISQDQVSRIIGLLGYLNRLDGFMDGLANDIKGISKEKAQIVNGFRRDMVEVANDVSNIVFIELDEQKL